MYNVHYKGKIYPVGGESPEAALAHVIELVESGYYDDIEIPKPGPDNIKVDAKDYKVK